VTDDLYAIPDRIWSKIYPEPNTGCWLWCGIRDRGGYGRVYLSPGREDKAHRQVWAAVHGSPVPNGAYVCHSCDNPPCVNPDHLWLGDARANRQDARGKGRIPVGDQHPSRRLPERRPRGARHWKARLTEAQVLEIRARYVPGHTARNRTTLADLAAEYGVGKSQIQNVVRRVQWTHL
jgi:hypothetical protein